VACILDHLVGATCQQIEHRRNFVCDGVTYIHHHFQLKVVVTCSTSFSKWNLQFWRKKIVPEAFCGLKPAENAIAAGAPPRTPLGELTTLRQTL